LAFKAPLQIQNDLLANVWLDPSGENVSSDDESNKSEACRDADRDQNIFLQFRHAFPKRIVLLIQTKEHTANQNTDRTLSVLTYTAERSIAAGSASSGPISMCSNPTG